MRRKANPKVLIPVLVLLTGISAAWALVAYRPQLESRARDVEPPVAQVMRVEPQALKLNIHSQGVVVPRTEIDLVPEVAGQVVRLHPSLVAGGFFAAGEVLISIDSRDYDYAIAAASARIAEAERQVVMEEAQAEQARTEWNSLGEGAPTPLTLREPQLAEARAKLKAARADLIKARLQRSRCEWRAPFAGRVRNRSIGLGQYVQPGEKLARLYATDVAQVRLPLATDQLAYLDLSLGRQDGQPARLPRVVLTAEFGGVEQHWSGRIVRTEGALDERTGLLYAVAEVEDPYAAKDGRSPLMPGLFVKAEIEGRVLPALFVLPPGAVNAADEVLRLDAETRLQIRRVKVLRREKDRVLVNGGLETGDRIVVSHVDVPVEGMKIHPDLVAPDLGSGPVDAHGLRGGSGSGGATGLAAGDGP